MNMLSFPSTKNPLQISTTPLCSFNFKPPKASYKPKHFHARDRVIDFGKHKGKMLGTLPSTYLKWVSSNLRARDFEEWAKLADEVLDDEVYRDRIEWEFAEKLLLGDVRDEKCCNAVDELVEISERFGWDNEDKLGWSKIDFGILGTSSGGRIPRLDDLRKRGVLDSSVVNKGIGRLDEGRKNEFLDSRMVNKGIGSRKNGNLDARMMNEGIGSRKNGNLDARMMNEGIGRLNGSRKSEFLDSRMMNEGIGRVNGSRKIESFDYGNGRLDESRKVESLDPTMLNEGIRVGNEGVGETRKERRERLRSRRHGGSTKNEFIGLMEKIGIEEKNESRLANSDEFRVKENESVDDERGNAGVQNRFPGRDGLLRKVLSRRTSF